MTVILAKLLTHEIGLPGPTAWPRKDKALLDEVTDGSLENVLAEGRSKGRERSENGFL